MGSPRPSRRCPCRTAPVLAFACAILLAAAVAGSDPAPSTVQPAELKRLSLEELMQIEVTSVSKHVERLSQAAAAITVITGEEIRRSGATSLPEVLRLANGLHVARFDSRTWAISARGFNLTTANKLLVLIDGRSIYTPLFSGVFWDVQDTVLTDVERIEVIRGPGATLWGANAVNGVINVITKPAAETQGGFVEAGGGEEERGFGALRWGGPLGGRGHYRAYAKHQRWDSLTFADGTDADDPLRRSQGGFRLDWTAGGGAATLQGDAYRGEIGSFFVPDTDVDGGNLIGRFTRPLAPGSELVAQAWFDRTHRRVPLQFEEDRDTWDLELRHHWARGRHDVLWGGGFRRTSDDVVNSAVVQWDPTSEAADLVNVFAQDDVMLGERLRLSVGAKLEDGEHAGPELQPSLRLAWTPHDHSIFWGAVSRAVREPTRIDRDVRFPVGGVVVIAGSKEFEREELVAYELGWRHLPRPDLSLDVATFYNVYDDLRSQEPPAGGGFPITLGNALEAETWGIEVRSAWEPLPRWRWYAAWAFLEKDFRLDPGSRDPTGGRGEGNDPRHRVQVRTALDLPRRLELDLWWRWVDELPAPRVPSYAELSLRLGWRPTDGLELSVLGQNLLDERHPEFGPATARREEVDRSVQGAVTWRF